MEVIYKFANDFESLQSLDSEDRNAQNILSRITECALEGWAKFC